MPSSASPAAEFSTPSIVPPVGVALVSRAALQNVAQPGVELRLSPQVLSCALPLSDLPFSLCCLYLRCFVVPFPFVVSFRPPFAAFLLRCIFSRAASLFVARAFCISRAAGLVPPYSLRVSPSPLFLSLSPLVTPMASGAPILTPPSVLTRTTRLSS